jgi:hypothetical protein
MSKQQNKNRATYQFVVDIDDETTRFLMALSIRWKRPVDWLIRNYLGGEVFNDAFRSEILDDDNQLLPEWQSKANTKLVRFFGKGGAS